MIKQITLPFVTHGFLLEQLIQREIKSRYKQSIVGYFWIILNPMLQLFVYTFVFSTIIRFPTNNIPYPVFLLSGLLPWIYLQTSLGLNTNVLIENSNLIKKVYFPREVFIYAVIISKAVDFLFTLVILIALMIFFKIYPDIKLFLIIPLFLIQVLLTSGLSFIFSATNLFYRDIQYLLNLIIILWMYLTPIIYPISLVPKNYLWIYKFNPMVGIIEGYRSILFSQPIDLSYILISVVSSVIIFSFGFKVFKKLEGTFSDVI